MNPSRMPSPCWKSTGLKLAITLPVTSKQLNRKMQQKYGGKIIDERIDQDVPLLLAESQSYGVSSNLTCSCKTFSFVYFSDTN